MPTQRSSPRPQPGPSSPRPPAPTPRPARLPSRVTFRLNGREYVGEGMTRLEALAEAVEQCAPLLRDALQAKRAREAGR